MAPQELLAHVPAKWSPVRRQEHAQNESQAWLLSAGDPRAADDTRRHERSLWCHPCDPDPADRRSPPSGRMGAAHMPRGVFLALAFGWGVVLAAVLGLVIAIRWMG